MFGFSGDVLEALVGVGRLGLVVLGVALGLGRGVRLARGQPFHLGQIGLLSLELLGIVFELAGCLLHLFAGLCRVGFRLGHVSGLLGGVDRFVLPLRRLIAWQVARLVGDLLLFGLKLGRLLAVSVLSRQIGEVALLPGQLRGLVVRGGLATERLLQPLQLPTRLLLCCHGVLFAPIKKIGQGAILRLYGPLLSLFLTRHVEFAQPFRALGLPARGLGQLAGQIFFRLGLVGARFASSIARSTSVRIWSCLSFNWATSAIAF